MYRVKNRGAIGNRMWKASQNVRFGKGKAMARETIGQLTPRYSFLLNPYLDIRLSKCPGCNGLTHNRKFALFIHIDGWGPLVLGKTCRYCTSCELIIVH